MPEEDKNSFYNLSQAHNGRNLLMESAKRYRKSKESQSQENFP